MFYLSEDIVVGMRWKALALQVFAKGGWSARREMQAKFAEATVNVTNDVEGVGDK